MKKLMTAALVTLTACAHSHEILPSDILVIRGSEAQIAGLLADERVKVGSTITLLSDTRPQNGVRELRYSMSENTPYRDIGGLVFEAQRHGNKTKFEARKP